MRLAIAGATLLENTGLKRCPLFCCLIFLGQSGVTMKIHESWRPVGKKKKKSWFPKPRYRSSIYYRRRPLVIALTSDEHYGDWPLAFQATCGGSRSNDFDPFSTPTLPNPIHPQPTPAYFSPGSVYRWSNHLAVFRCALDHRLILMYFRGPHHVACVLGIAAMSIHQSDSILLPGQL